MSMGTRRGGGVGQEGYLTPSPGNSKIWGPPKDSLAHKKIKGTPHSKPRN